MLCYFLRHGPAEDAETWQGSDFDRPLTPQGRKRIAKEAKTIATLDLELDAIATSPLVRARETAEIVAKELKLEKLLVEDERVGPGFSPAQLANIIRDRHPQTGIMLVGHEPSISQTISNLIGNAAIDFKKGSLACITLTSNSPLHGELLFLATPKLLTRD
jgi:phosphohistidine phosphatase